MSAQNMSMFYNISVKNEITLFNIVNGFLCFHVLTLFYLRT